MDDPEIPLRQYIEKIIDERHTLYQTQFQEVKDHMTRALAAIIETRTSAHAWLSILLSLLAILVSVLVLIRR